MTNRTYSDLHDLVESLAGVDSFTSAEQTKILALANRRLYQAYAASEVWPRYLSGMQALPSNDGVIAYSYDEVAGVRTASGATRSGTTVTIVTTAAVTFVPGMEVTISGLTGSTTPNGTHTVTSVSETNVDNDTFTFTLSSGTGSETYTGTGTITPAAVPDVADFQRIWSGNPLTGQAGGYELDFWVDVDGAHIVTSTGSEGLVGVYVSYRTVWPGPYLSSATDIPEEFFWYVAHATYADFLRGDGQVDKAMAEEKAAEAYLMLEIDRADSTRNNNTIYRRIWTHTSRQAR